jgi:hypothetical protein
MQQFPRLWRSTSSPSITGSASCPFTGLARWISCLISARDLLTFCLRSVGFPLEICWRSAWKPALHAMLPMFVVNSVPGNVIFDVSAQYTSLPTSDPSFVHLSIALLPGSYHVCQVAWLVEARARRFRSRERKEIDVSKTPYTQVLDEPPPSHMIGQRFVYATGLRYTELQDLRMKDIHQKPDGRVQIDVAGYGEIPTRQVPVLAGFEQEVLALAENPHVFGNFQIFPTHWGMQSLRRAYACQLFQQLQQDRPDAVAISEVMQALGHQNREVVMRTYLLLDKAAPLA